MNIGNTLNKVTLKYELDLDFVLVAITSSLKDYRLCYFINKFTGLELTKTDDHEIWLSPAEGQKYFSRYAAVSDDVETEYFLLANRSPEGGTLIPEMKHSDYFFVIRNFIDEEDLETLLAAVSEIPEVVVASEISPQKLKSKENLVF